MLESKGPHHNKMYFVGIGGIGMSALARFFKAQGKEVSGSDMVETALTRELQEEGISVCIGHESLPPDLDVLVYSEAVPASDPQRMEAAARGIPQKNYFKALGEATEAYKVVAISGSHGKSTTTAMLGLILIEAGLDPTVLVGTKVREFGNKNLRVGKSEFFVVEACEYRRDFLFLKPELLVVLNMDFDHMDYFKDFEDYQAAFHELAAQSQEVLWPGEVAVYEGPLGVSGKHNRMNAGVAAHVARKLGATEEAIERALGRFTGTWRRFEHRGTLNGAPCLDDYAHHPTEIRATLAATREAYPVARIVAVFEPHQYNRTVGLLEEFSRAFEGADEVIIPSIYEVRDQATDKSAISAEGLAKKIGEHHAHSHFLDGLDATASYLKEKLTEKDVLVVMGAGPIDALFEKL